ncbi:MAG TPA: RdgB/HAM1 family non-canonical purine NTP pyrophosphatase [Phycisphaerae bacterium]|nr:RdgB/HAM1 family non-canonical purine NTP pyrophosphatase [Phycisphaerae bacterium]HRY69952.1 RdgB/HAM1 family non-canonical purine NTP pyrophosphatase [Phycisphaerae bacterium]HSA27161.1 RdgB/HAM1 family non-canonical purine NTP pyrophosphatase [Phycisphaerae bacterium]
MREILLATGNQDKAREMEEILSIVEAGMEAIIRWRRLSEYPGIAEPVEDGRTFRSNAELKAHYYARRTGLWTIADDSGLEVDALAGEPGVRSARYAGEKAGARANNLLLIQKLAGVPPARRSARFRCVVVLSDGLRCLASAEGTIEGRIIDEARGCNGFGYDPHFWYEPDGMTTAEMTSPRKHEVSHRGQALKRLREQLGGLLGSGEVA